MKAKSNSTGLHIWIAENGGNAARKLICDSAEIHDRTLWRILHGDMPRFVTRYRIFKLTNVKLSDEDEFPDIMSRQDAS